MMWRRWCAAGRPGGARSASRARGGAGSRRRRVSRAEIAMSVTALLFAGAPDLSLDSGNATGIFAATRAGRAAGEAQASSGTSQ